MTNLNITAATGNQAILAKELDGLFRRIRDNDVAGGVYDSKFYVNGCWCIRLEVFKTTTRAVIVDVTQLTKSDDDSGFSVSDRMLAMSVPVYGGYSNRIIDIDDGPFDNEDSNHVARALGVLKFLSLEDEWTKQ